LAAVPRPVAVLIVSLALLAAGCGSEKQAASTPKPTPTATATATATAAPAAGGCAKVADPGPKQEGHLTKPHTKLDPKKTYVATVKTSCGTFKIALDAKRAPITGGNFAYLVGKHFFDKLKFHRIVAGFVIQGGDPKGDGTGGPGYTVVEAPPSHLTYKPGVVAMAKTQTDPSGASGSQFFVVTGAGAASLQPIYALLGKVTQGMDVVKRIGAVQADPNTGQPVSPVVIDSIRIKAS
jgi:peptidyl-prolyl cis-trans isomerase B (cyclophilin B)